MSYPNLPLYHADRCQLRAPRAIRWADRRATSTGVLFLFVSLHLKLGSLLLARFGFVPDRLESVWIGLVVTRRDFKASPSASLVGSNSGAPAAALAVLADCFGKLARRLASPIYLSILAPPSNQAATGKKCQQASEGAFGFVSGPKLAEISGGVEALSLNYDPSSNSSG